MLFLQLGMERKAVSPSGSSRTLGERAGVTMATLRWSLGRTCAVSFPVNFGLCYWLGIEVQSLIDFDDLDCRCCNMCIVPDCCLNWKKWWPCYGYVIQTSSCFSLGCCTDGVVGFQLEDEEGLFFNGDCNVSVLLHKIRYKTLLIYGQCNDKHHRPLFNLSCHYTKRYQSSIV